MSDRFRPQYRELSESEQQFVEAVKNTAEIFEAILDNPPGGPGRENSIAMTKLEECVMWSVKGATGPRP